MDVQGVVQTYSNLGRLGQIPTQPTDRPDFRPQDGAESGGQSRIQPESTQNKSLEQTSSLKKASLATEESSLTLSQAQELTQSLSSFIAQPEWMALSANAHDVTQVNMLTPRYV